MKSMGKRVIKSATTFSQALKMQEPKVMMEKACIMCYMTVTCITQVISWTTKGTSYDFGSKFSLHMY